MNLYNRNNTKKINIGNKVIGGNERILIQSMTNTDTRDIKSTINQVKRLEEAGCDIVRFAIVDMEAARAINEIKKSTNIPIVADIHFDYKLAIESIKNGADKIRINPGNIGGEDRVKAVVEVAKDRGIPIRIGVNSGSIEKEILLKYGGITKEGIVESALKHANMLEKYNFDNIVFSLKASSVPLTLESHKLMVQKTNYPLHIGITESGTIKKGTIKSAVGIGSLLTMGIGDTLRVSLTGDPVEEIVVGREILKSLGLIEEGIELISCPTCGRCKLDLVDVANKVEKHLDKIDKKIKVAIMGCAVNGPGEAKEADIGIAGGDNCALLFIKGDIVKKIPYESIVQELLLEIEKL